VGGPGNHRDTPERPRSCVTPAAIPARAHAASPQPRAAPTRFKTTRYARLAAPAAWLLPEVDSPRGEQPNCVFPGQRPVLCGRYEPLPGVDPPRRSPSPARRPEPAVFTITPLPQGGDRGLRTSRGPPDCVNAQPYDARLCAPWERCPARTVNGFSTARPAPPCRPLRATAAFDACDSSDDDAPRATGHPGLAVRRLTTTLVYRSITFAEAVRSRPRCSSSTRCGTRPEGERGRSSGSTGPLVPEMPAPAGPTCGPTLHERCVSRHRPNGHGNQYSPTRRRRALVTQGSVGPWGAAF
jgi:hypothetical protein